MASVIRGSDNFDSLVHQGVGVNQTWQNMSGSRAINTVYTNTSSKPILIDISFNKTNSSEFGYIITESKNISKQQFDGGGLYTYNFQALVRAGQTYSMVVPSINSLLEWNELR